MNVIKMYCAVDRIRNYIWFFNQQYRRQNKIDVSYVIADIQEVRRIGEEDILYWEKTEVDFQMLYHQEDKLKKAVQAKDFVFVYDQLNYELRNMTQIIFDVLFAKSSIELGQYFWSENRNALKIRYPEVLKQLEMIDDKKESIRSYGTRGKVVYRTEENREYDLYSAYNPIESGLLMAEGIDLCKYNKLYVWGFNGGFEIDGISYSLDGNRMDFEVFITDLSEFRQILLSTPRKCLLLNPDVKWHFNAGIMEFVNGIDLQKKESSYIYSAKSQGNDVNLLKEFICKYSLNSNIGV